MRETFYPLFQVPRWLSIYNDFKSMTSEHPSGNTIDWCTGSTFPIWRSTYQQPLGSIYTRSFLTWYHWKECNHLGNRSDPDTLGGIFFLDPDFTTEKGTKMPPAPGTRVPSPKTYSKFTTENQLLGRWAFLLGGKKGLFSGVNSLRG